MMTVDLTRIVSGLDQSVAQRISDGDDYSAQNINQTTLDLRWEEVDSP
jgi:hypothetical protein